MTHIDQLRLLVVTLRDCARSNLEVSSDYNRGKAKAYEFAAKWLEQEVDCIEKESR